MVCVFPGVSETFTKFLEFTSMLINDDLPTLLLPIKANSGISAGGHLSVSVKLAIYFAFLIIILMLTVSAAKVAVLKLNLRLYKNEKKRW